MMSLIGTDAVQQRDNDSDQSRNHPASPTTERQMTTWPTRWPTTNQPAKQLNIQYVDQPADQLLINLPETAS